MAEDCPLFPELKITVQNDGKVIAEVPASGKKKSDGKIDNDQLLLETLKTFRDWLNQGRLNITAEREMKLLGLLLRRLLFESGGPDVRDLVDNTLRQAESKICVQLEFQDEQAVLQSLPWEFLYDTVGKCFFAMSNYLVLTRFIPSGEDRHSLSSEELPLRMLVIVSGVPGLSPVMRKDAINAIKEFADKNPKRIVFDDPIENMSFIQLQNRLRQLKNNGKQPHLIHFIGHGRYNKSKRQGEVAMPNASGDEAEWLDQDQFTRLFTDTKCVPRLLFLQLCEGAAVEEGEMIASFEGLVPALVSADVQAVVAMQFPIKQTHAKQICINFYDELTKGVSVGEAVQTARYKMLFSRTGSVEDDKKPNPLAAGTPVLYMFGYDGPIVCASSPPAQNTGGGSLAGGSTGTSGGLPARPESDPAQTASAGTLDVVAGGSAAVSESGPAQTIKSSPTGSSSIPSVTGGLSAELDKILTAGAQKIKEMTQGGGVTQAMQAKETSDKSMSLSKTLYLEVIPKLRDKTLPEMRLILALQLKREEDTPLGTILDTMFNTSVIMSSAELSKVVAAGIKKIVDITQGDQTKQTTDESILLNEQLHVEVIPKLHSKTVNEIRIELAELLKCKENTPLGTVIYAMFNASVNLS